MGYKQDFKVNITRLTTAVAQKGFGTILILSNDEDLEVKSYVEIADVAEDFELTTDTYKLASALFGQGVDEILIAGTELGELVDTLNKTIKTNDSFFGLVCTDNSSEAIAMLSDWIDTQEKVYAVTSQDKTIKSASNHTMIAYHPEDYLAEKGLAYMLTREIGSVDLDGKAVDSITSSNVDSTEYSALEENNINVALKKYGNVVIDGGDMAGGEPIDVILSEFWIKLRMEEDLAALKMNTPKIAYMTDGVALLIDAANTRLKLAVKQEIIALDGDGMPEYEITYLPVDEVPASDRANRDYSYVKWSARLAGSIRTGIIEGILTV